MINLNKKTIIITGGVIVLLLALLFLAFQQYPRLKTPISNNPSEGVAQVVAPKATSSNVAVLANTGLSQLSQLGQYVEAVPITQTNCQTQAGATPEKCQLLIDYTAAVKSEATSSCLSIQDFGMRNDCLYELLHKLKNPALCAIIEKVGLKERCEEETGIESQGIKFCQTIDSKHEQQECVDRTTAINVGRKKMTQPNQKGPDPMQDCNNIKTLEYSYLCEVNAMKVGSAGCGVLTDASARQRCIDRANFTNAKSRTECDKVVDENFKKVCQLNFDNQTNPNYKYDEDNDGLTNEKELWINTDPFKADTDGDGLSDSDEYNNFKTDPTNPDTDNDGLKDFDEVKYHTDPGVADTDGDGHNDVDEIKNGYNPCGAGKLPSDAELLLACAKYKK